MNRWPSVQLGTVLTPVVRAQIPIAGDTYRQIGVKLWGEGAYERESVDGGATKYRQLFRAETGDVIVNKIWARNGSVAVVPQSLSGCFGSNEFPMFASNRERVLPAWLHWLTKTATFWAQCDEKSRGTSGQNRIRPERFLEVQIPLPSLTEQREVVGRIEKLAVQINEAHTLGKQIKTEVRALKGAFARNLTSRFSDRVPVEKVADVRGGIQKGPHRAPGANPVRYITVAHVQRNRILAEDPRYFELTADELERWRLRAGDVLIIEGNGSAQQIGRTALFLGEIPDCVHQNHVIRIRPDPARLLPEFLNWFLNSPAGQDAVQAQSRTTSGLRTLSVGRIKQIEVPVPPLTEQRRLMAELDTLQAEMTTLTCDQDETAAALGALLPAILDRAFKEGL